MRLFVHMTAEQLGDALAVGWEKYTEFFGEVPHGTVPQMRAMACLCGFKLDEPGEGDLELKEE